jgi:CheY-like chemotaxis protein
MKKIKKVLLIDDNRADNLFHRHIIQNSGLVECVEFAKNGQEGIDMLRKDSDLPELIFLDINMPVMDGYEFLEELEKCQEIAAPIVIVMLTTSIMAEDRLKAKTYSVLTDFINKPLKKDEVVNIIQEYC